MFVSVDQTSQSPWWIHLCFVLVWSLLLYLDKLSEVIRWENEMRETYLLYVKENFPPSSFLSWSPYAILDPNTALGLLNDWKCNRLLFIQFCKWGKSLLEALYYQNDSIMLSLRLKLQFHVFYNEINVWFLLLFVAFLCFTWWLENHLVLRFL